MWTPLVSWITVAVVVPVLITLAVGVLSMSPPAFSVAQIAFTLSAAILAARFGWWIAFEMEAFSVANRIIFSGVMFGLIGSLWIGAIIWVRQRQPVTMLVIECQPWKKKPINPDMVLLRLSPEAQAIGATEHFLAGSWPRVRYESVHFASINRWQVTNYGPAPVFKVSFVLTLHFRQAVSSQDSGVTPGKVIVSREWPVQIAKIDPGSGSSFVFYAANRSPHFLDIVPPDSATLEIFGETERRTVPVRLTNRTWYDLGPGLP